MKAIVIETGEIIDVKRLYPTIYSRLDCNNKIIEEFNEDELEFLPNPNAKTCKEKVFIVCQTKVFRDESYGDPDLTLCKTQEIAHREFLSLVESELDEYIDDDDLDCLNDELFDNGELKDGDEPKTLEDLTLQQKIDLYSKHHFDVSFSDELGHEHCSFDTSDESSTSITIIESEMITK